MNFATRFLAAIMFIFTAFHNFPSPAGSFMPQLSISEKVPACLKAESEFSNGKFKDAENDHRVLKITNDCAQNILIEKIQFFFCIRRSCTARHAF
jgi:hypothetical protein